MAKYAQYLFNLQHNTGCTVIEQCTQMNKYKDQSIRTSLELERLGHENHILLQGTFGIREKDQELHSLYRHFSEVEHGLNHTRTQLELAQKEVATRTHAIVHLENVVEMQDTKLDEKEEQIANLLH
jgi:hypothetical protein